MNEAPTVTIYITNYNYGRYLRKAVDSVLDQKYSSWELIIIDDGSTDNSRKILLRYEHHPKIQIVYQDNKGLNVSNNIALRLSRGKYIMRLDADDYLDENALVVLANILDQHPDIGLVYPDYYRVDADGKIIDIHRRNKLDKEITVYDIPAHGACTLIRKECLIDIGGYSEDVRCQDGYDLWIRFIRKYKVYNVNVPLFYYRQHGSNMTKDEKTILEARHKIKRREIALSGKDKKFRTIGIIPARGRDYKEAAYALRKMKGGRLIDYTVRAALETGALGDIVVVSEDKEILDYVNGKFKGVKALPRPERYSRINSPIEPTIKYVLNHMRKHGKVYDAFVILYINCPLRTSAHIQKAVDTMLLFDVDCVLSVYEDISDHYQHIKNGLRPLFPKRLLRLEREALMVANGAVYMARIKQLKKKDFLSGSIGHSTMTRNESFKVQGQDDWPIVEKMLEMRRSG